jgi:anti-anti-sigma factor
MERDFNIEAVHGDGSLRLVLRGELDLATAPLLKAALVEAEAGSSELIVIDLADVPFIDSTGLRALVEAHLRSQQNGDRLRISGGSEQALKLFKLAGVLERLPFVATDDGVA